MPREDPEGREENDRRPIIKQRSLLICPVRLAAMKQMVQPRKEQRTPPRPEPKVDVPGKKSKSKSKKKQAKSTATTDEVVKGGGLGAGGSDSWVGCGKQKDRRWRVG